MPDLSKIPLHLSANARSIWTPPAQDLEPLYDRLAAMRDSIAVMTDTPKLKDDLVKAMNNLNDYIAESIRNGYNYMNTYTVALKALEEGGKDITEVERMEVSSELKGYPRNGTNSYTRGKDTLTNSFALILKKYEDEGKTNPNIVKNLNKVTKQLGDTFPEVVGLGANPDDELSNFWTTINNLSDEMDLAFRLQPASLAISKFADTCLPDWRHYLTEYNSIRTKYLELSFH